MTELFLVPTIPNVPVPLKRCSNCKADKPLDEFHSNRTKKDGKRSDCNLCSNERVRKYHEANTEKIRERKRKYTYNLEPERFAAMRSEQDDRCGICRVPFGDIKPEVDHDHTCCPGRKSCGKCVRGLLCKGCNGRLATAKDNPLKLKIPKAAEAAEYLARYALAKAA